MASNSMISIQYSVKIGQLVQKLRGDIHTDRMAIS